MEQTVPAVSQFILGKGTALEVTMQTYMFQSHMDQYPC